MRRFFTVTIAVMVLALGAGWIGIRRYPERQAKRAMDGIVERAGGANRFFHERLPDERWKTIVRPSPDLLYSAMVFDLRDGPLAITFPAHGEYWSAQFIDPETSSFADLGFADGLTTTTTVRLVTGDDVGQADDAVHVVQSEYPHGVVVLRYLVRQADNAPRIDAVRRQVVVGR